jgi:hypothetical protein
MRLRITKHAVDRYVERAKPHLGHRHARWEIEALLEFAEEVERPSWYLGYGGGEPDSYLLIAPDCAAIVIGDAIVSVITREAADEPARRRKREMERKRRTRDRTKRSNHDPRSRNRPERPRARIEDEAWPV